MSPRDGSWARKVVPSGYLTLYDAAERIGLKPEAVRMAMHRHGIAYGVVRRVVLLAPGVLRKRSAIAITPTSFDALIRSVGGYRSLNDPS